MKKKKQDEEKIKRILSKKVREEDFANFLKGKVFQQCKAIEGRVYFKVFLHSDELIFLFKESQKLEQSPEWYIHDIMRSLLKEYKKEKAEVKPRLSHLLGEGK